MTNPQLYLIRHAQALGSDEVDPPLSDLGTVQAGALGARLATCGVARILCSPRLRARNTGEIITRTMPGVTVEVFELLDDRTPVPSPQRRSDYPSRYWDWLAAVPAAERDIDGRTITNAVTELADMARAVESCPVVAITHAFVIGWIVRAALDAPTATWLRLTPANAGLTILDCTADDIDLTAYNDTGHLRAVGPPTRRMWPTSPPRNS